MRDTGRCWILVGSIDLPRHWSIRLSVFVTNLQEFFIILCMNFGLHFMFEKVTGGGITKCVQKRMRKEGYSPQIVRTHTQKILSVFAKSSFSSALGYN